VVAGVSAPASHLDLAEGFVSPSFDEYLSVLNPGMTAATANITYLVSGGAPFTQVVGVPANSRQTVHVNQVLQPYVSAAIHIDSTQPLVVERPMYFVYNGWTGGHDAVATSSASLTSTAYFAEGTTLPQFREYLTVENPNAGTVPVTLTYYTASGTVVKGLGLAGLSRTTIQVFAGDMSANGACDPVTSCGVGSGVPGVSVLVQATGAQPILVERPMYFDY
jgi:hypothetical protein